MEGDCGRDGHGCELPAILAKSGSFSGKCIYTTARLILCPATSELNPLVADVTRTMTTEKFDITATRQWPRLKSLAASAGETKFAGLLDQARADRYQLAAAGLYLDCSRNLVTDEIMDILFELAESSPLAGHREAMFRGEAINTTEQRPVLHAALRASAEDLRANGLGELAADIEAQKRRIREVSDRIRAGEWLGATGKPVRDVVNLGIGGSDLGPKLACEALKEFGHEEIRCHFVSNVDGESIRSNLRALDPETTLVIISSKSFTTQETLLNANTAAQWFRDRLGIENPFASPHFIGVTAAPAKAMQAGVPEDQLLLFGEWVGGRYSLWSAIGLSIAITTGYDNFARMLDGARQMDLHFRTAPAARNMPVILALLGIWYANFLDAESQGVIPYCERLLQLPFYLQQLDMESNGKSVSLSGEPVGQATGPIVWGLTGTNSQHSFFQLLHQGTHLVPVDFIGLGEDALSSPEHHRVLLANMIAQSAALMEGKQSAELPPWRNYSGNRPSNVLLIDRLTPESFGALLALYEHKVFVQGSMWNINSFDQWGVELGKELANRLLDENFDRSRLDAGSRALLDKLNW